MRTTQPLMGKRQDLSRSKHHGHHQTSLESHPVVPQSRSLSTLRISLFIWTYHGGMPTAKRSFGHTLVISVQIVKFTIWRILIDQGSSTDILFWTTFQTLGLLESLLGSYAGEMFDFTGEQVNVWGYIDLFTRFREGNSAKEISVRYLVVNSPSSYNVILGWSSLKMLGAMVSTPYLTIKYPILDTRIGTVRANQKIARQCYNESLKITISPYLPASRVHQIPTQTVMI
jgi:hypothetical protein